MNAVQHHLFGAATWAAMTFSLHADPKVIATGAALSAVTSGGILSPDIDQFKIFHRWFRWWPGRTDDLIFGHRRLLHWWGLPATAAVIVLLLPGSQADKWPFWALIFGWTSHLVGDFIFGKAGYDIPKGVPLMPFWAHVGVGFRSGGLVNWLFVLLVLAGTYRLLSAA